MYPGPWYGPGRHVHEGLGWGGWLLWALFMVALWALVIMAVVWLVRSFTHRGPMTGQRGTQVHSGPLPWRSGGGFAGGAATASAEQILAERFAHGQIDENEYSARLAVLRGERRPMTAEGAPPAGASAGGPASAPAAGEQAPVPGEQQG